MTDIANALDSSNDLKLDAQTKKIIANKKFLARLLHQYVPEFMDYSAEEIAEKYIDENSVRVSQAAVERDLTNTVFDDSLQANNVSTPVGGSEDEKSASPAAVLQDVTSGQPDLHPSQTLSDSVEGIGNEDTTLTEGKVTYDIIFKVIYPDRDSEFIGMYINVEAQANYHPGYPVETRALYYAARRFASQLKRISQMTDYGLLQKVYSIWICMGDDVPKKLAGTVTMYHETPVHLVGKADLNPEIYNKIKIIMIRFNDAAEIEDPYLKSLQELFSRKTTRQQKIEALEAQGIEMDSELEGDVEHMCNYSAYIRRTARQEGRQEGRQDEKADMALRLLADHFSYEMISKYTGLSVDKIKSLEKQMAMA